VESASNEFLDLLDEPGANDDLDHGRDFQIIMRSHIAEPEPFQQKE
jgi:hypothetical protein